MDRTQDRGAEAGAGIYNMNMMENIISAVPERELVNNSAMF